ncbi:hypothetical protein BDAP_001798 [Binucleata daphniae]
MSVCIVGAGPAGLYTAKYLLQNNIKTTIFEKLTHPFGLFKCGFSPYSNYKPSYFSSVLQNKNLVLNLSKNIKDLRSIENRYDAFVIATGCGKPNKLQIPDFEHTTQAIDIITSENGCNNKKHNLGSKLLVIGCGNVCMDLVRLLFDKHIQKITILSRSKPEVSSYTNSALRDVYEIQNLRIKNNKLIENNVNNNTINRRKQIMEKDKTGTRTLTFLYNAIPLKIEKNNFGYTVTINIDGKNIKKTYDNVISSIGFTKNRSVDSSAISKPVFHVGWCKLPTGSLSTIKYDAEKTAKKIVKYIETNIKNRLK